MNINHWSRDLLLELGISEKDVKQLRGLGIRLQLLHETLRRETREMCAKDDGIDPPFTPNEKRYLRLVDRIQAIVARYDDLITADADTDGGYAVCRVSELREAVENDDPGAYERVPRVELTW